MLKQTKERRPCCKPQYKHDGNECPNHHGTLYGIGIERHHTGVTYCKKANKRKRYK